MKLPYALVILAWAVVLSSSASARRELHQARCPIEGCALACDLLPGDVPVWTCAQCQSGFILSADQKVCACPAGRKENPSPSGTRCIACGINNFCPGGTGNTDPTRGPSIACGPGFSTKGISTASRSTQCLLLPGFRLVSEGNSTSPPIAAPCPENTYNPGQGRLSSCYKCPSGLVVDAGVGTSSRNCRVPSGYFWSRGRVLACSRGTYRAGDLPTTDSAATICKPCGPGIATSGPRCKATGNTTACTDVSACNQVVPGWRGDAVSSNGTVTAASACPIGSYNPGYGAGVSCTTCPWGTTTQIAESNEPSDCLVPPGFYVPSGQNMQQCPDGSYRRNWASRTMAASCVGCSGVFPPAGNDSVPSRPNDPLDHPMGPLVRGSALSCYISAGEGMVRFDSNWKRVAPCPANTYGVQETTYGLQASPCRPCATGLVTHPLVNGTGWTNMSACYNRAGWGIIGNGLGAPCETGTYNAAGSMTACNKCGKNRYTMQGAQAAKTDCLVLPGFGLVDANENFVNQIAANQMTSAQAADATVLECPPTHYSPGGEVNSVCILCPGGHSAAGPGAANVTECDLCPAGLGENVNGTCSPCSDTTFNDGTSNICQGCPNMTFISEGKSDVLTGGTVAPSASLGDDMCFAEYGQLHYEQGLYILPPQELTSLGTMPNVNACAAACNDTCQYFTFEYANTAQNDSTGICYVRFAPTGILSSTLLYYKMIPSNEMGGQTISKTVSGGWYMKHYMVIGEAWQGRDVAVPPSQNINLNDCLLACDMDTSCVLVYYNSEAATVKCSLRTGGASSAFSLLRTAIYGEPEMLVQTQGADGTTCTANEDCMSSRCNLQNKTCSALHCMDRVWNYDETGRDCGGSDCPACPANPANCTTAITEPAPANAAWPAENCVNTTSATNCTGPCNSGWGGTISSLCYDGTFGPVFGSCIRLPSCTDGLKNGEETAVDCGGSTCPKCQAGLACNSNSDCASSHCNNATHLCVAATCSDGIKNGNESATDCGGSSCPKCGADATCVDSGDCWSNNCVTTTTSIFNNATNTTTNVTTSTCAAATCSDTIKNGNETGTDCGGSCGPCAVGVTCEVGSDCSSGNCVSVTNATTNVTTKTCAAASCSDGILNGAETGVDCGGPCGPCGAGSSCNVDADCISVHCTTVTNNVTNATTKSCAAATCSDGIKNANESGVDCGGSSCPKCAANTTCVVHGDCLSNSCVTTTTSTFNNETNTTTNSTTSTCAAATCSDGILNGAETGVDCGGGSCSACGVGVNCTVGSDCSTSSCNATSGTCAAATCSDGVKNGAETDVDCGGPTCGACTAGATCATPSDCVSLNCASTTNSTTNVTTACAAATCSDGIQNGNETATDCGGSSCNKCAVNATCVVHGDCLSNNCVATTTSTFNNATNTTTNVTTNTCAAASCSDGILNGFESAMDCGGSCNGCPNGETCNVPSDCSSGSCVSTTNATTNVTTKACAAATCSDGFKNGNETGVDCGGPQCGACTAGATCEVASDCASLNCVSITNNATNTTTKTCAAVTCLDGIENGDETDVDCGGLVCGACGTGLNCSSNVDCSSQNCNNVTKTCVAANCTDGIKNGGETDIDCGGAACGKCPDAFGCSVNSDCQSKVCNTTSKICLAPTCSDGVVNGNETCTDAGGTCPTRCAATSPCLSDNDCISYRCNNSTNSTFGVCAADVDGCAAAINPCSSVATCTDLPPPSTTANCTCPPGYAGDGKLSGTGCSPVGSWDMWFALRHSSNLCVAPTTNFNSLPGDGDIVWFAPCTNASLTQWQHTQLGALRNKEFGVCISSKTVGNATVATMSYDCTTQNTVFSFEADGTLRHNLTGKCLNPATFSPVNQQQLTLEDCATTITFAKFAKSDLDFCDNVDNGSPYPCAANATCTPVAGTPLASAYGLCACTGLTLGDPYLPGAGCS